MADSPAPILAPEIRDELLKIHQRGISEGWLPSLQQLETYYGNFRQRFGIDRLLSMDGEALLEAMHNSGNKDSLVYWLEFKNDDEFPARFGSIAGGSALKFGVYKRVDTGAWMTGSPQSQRETSVGEAIDIARHHRDLLAIGCDLLRQLPADAPDDMYRDLDAAMWDQAREVSDTAWGHKYFHLMFPDKLDDYHVTEYQRFHLVKLLQVPREGGRYAPAGQFIRMATELGLHVNIFTNVLGERNGRPYRYWRIGTSDSTKPRNRWDPMKNGGFVAIGWDKLDDLSQYVRNQESKDSIKALMAEHYPGEPSAVGRAAQQVFYFATTIAEGDIVIAADGADILGIARITGPYVYDPTSDFPHHRPVDWLNLDEWKLPVTEGLRTTVYGLKKSVQNLIEIERRILGATPIAPPTPTGDGEDRLPSLGGIPLKIKQVLDRKGQIILYGPPGTGKTYWAESTARELASRTAFKRSTGQLAQQQLDAITDGLVRICTFHPAYGYEDFMEGYRPEEVNGQLTFRLKDGLFTKLCTDARNEPARSYYLIIDEINRGDIPRIFGELITLLERSKRGKVVRLPMSGRPFSIPPNVYVIGTMNTADRSIALLDTALRRRFGFLELMPDSSVLGSSVIEGIPLGPWLDALNSRIREHLGRDARNLQIGHSYLMDGDKPISTFQRLSQALQYDLLPLLEEYCYEDYQTLERLLGKGLVDVDHQRYRTELFQPERQGDLVQALLSESPGITTSAQAIGANDPTEEQPDVDDQDDTSAEAQ